ncbi:hypothetical protein NHQ30_006169 [Ciborinia camelliae]|nr:hypothetical protein NHQ30_006169 [Ciborinia camelliae]
MENSNNQAYPENENVPDPPPAYSAEPVEGEQTIRATSLAGVQTIQAAAASPEGEQTIQAEATSEELKELFIFVAVYGLALWVL